VIKSYADWGNAMTILVTYFTQTGNTEKVAKAIYEAIGGKKEILPVNEAKNPDGYDIIFCGFPVHAHSVPLPVQNFIKSIPPSKKLALFVTHGSLRGGELATTAIEHAISLASKLKVLGTFGCRGKVDPKIIEALLKKPEHRAWAETAKSAASHPDESDAEDARQFAKRILTTPH
jgi:flavodoxin